MKLLLRRKLETVGCDKQEQKNLLDPKFLQSFHRATILKIVRKQNLSGNKNKSNLKLQTEDKLVEQREQGGQLNNSEYSAQSKPNSQLALKAFKKSFSSLFKSVTRNTEVELGLSRAIDGSHHLTKNSFRLSSSKISPMHIQTSSKSSAGLFITDFDKAIEKHDPTFTDLSSIKTTRNVVVHTPISESRVKLSRNSTSREKRPAANHSSQARARIIFSDSDRKCHIVDHRTLTEKPIVKIDTARHTRIKGFDAETTPIHKKHHTINSIETLQRTSFTNLSKPIQNPCFAPHLGLLKIQMSSIKRLDTTS